MVATVTSIQVDSTDKTLIDAALTTLAVTSSEVIVIPTGRSGVVLAKVVIT